MEPDSESLRFIASSFSRAYEDSVSRMGHQDFIKIYKIDGTIIEKSFAEFHRDVERVKALIYPLKESHQVLVTIDSTTYENLIFMTAGWLANFIVSPMNPNEGAKRIQSKLDQINLNCLVVAREDFEELQINGSRITMQIPEGAPEALAIDIDRDPYAPFTFIFTSGSTGYSKIVMQSEIGVLSNIDALIERHGLHVRKVIATPLPVFHVNALEFSFLCSLLSGQRLVLYEQFNFNVVLQSLEIDRIQIFSAMPQILRVFLELASKINSIPNLKLEYVLSAASSLSPDLASKLCGAFQFKIIQGYGLSEAVNFSLTLSPQLSKRKVDYWLTRFSRPSVGTALFGNEVFILKELREVDEGEVGEVCIRGFNVMLGYKGQNNEDVFWGEYLHTGDLGFYHTCADSGEKYFFINSRVKDVIKRQGQTISLAEMDDYLLRWSPTGISAISVPFENKFAGEELGVVVDSRGSAEQLASLQNFLISEIPSFMRPRVIVTSKEKLTTDSGKPKRWIFVDLFQEFKDQYLGEIPLIKDR